MKKTLIAFLLKVKTRCKIVWFNQCKAVIVSPDGACRIYLSLGNDDITITRYEVDLSLEPSFSMAMNGVISYSYLTRVKKIEYDMHYVDFYKELYDILVGFGFTDHDSRADEVHYLIQQYS